MSLKVLNLRYKIKSSKLIWYFKKFQWKIGIYISHYCDMYQFLTNGFKGKLGKIYEIAQMFLMRN